MLKGLTSKADARLKPALPGFTNVYRYWDARFAKVAVKLQPGECYVTKNDEMLVTVLGSCIAACIRDPVAGVGGMNHFMLPEQAVGHEITRSSLNNPELCYGNWAMEHLINSIIKCGGMRNRLEIKLFGGGRVLANMVRMDIGQRNIEFVESFLANDELPVVAKDLGGNYPRKILYFAATGQAKMKKMGIASDVNLVKQEKAYLDSLATKPSAGDVELF